MDMQELRKLRTSNFALIVKTKGLSQIVEITGRQKSQISDCAAGRRTIGERLARSLPSTFIRQPFQENSLLTDCGQSPGAGWQTTPSRLKLRNHASLTCPGVKFHALTKGLIIWRQDAPSWTRGALMYTAVP